MILQWSSVQVRDMLAVTLVCFMAGAILQIACDLDWGRREDRVKMIYCCLLISAIVLIIRRI